MALGPRPASVRPGTGRGSTAVSEVEPTQAQVLGLIGHGRSIRSKGRSGETCKVLSSWLQKGGIREHQTHSWKPRDGISGIPASR